MKRLLLSLMILAVGACSWRASVVKTNSYYGQQESGYNQTPAYPAYPVQPLPHAPPVAAEPPYRGEPQPGHWRR